MTITLNGTTGIQNVLGSAASPAESNTTNSNTGVYFPTSTSVGFSAAGAVALTVDASNNIFYTGGAERMRIDSSGKVGININYGLSQLTIGNANSGGNGAYATYPGTFTINEASLTTLQSTGGIEFKGSVFGSGYGAKILSTDNGSLLFGYRANSATWTEAARIDSSGNLLVGTTSASGLITAGPVAGKTGVQSFSNTNGNPAVQGTHSVNNASAYVAYFSNSGSGTGLYISNTAAWQSTSDARLKTDIQDLNSTERLLQLRPRNYLWKSQETSDTPTKRSFGFIAQEMQQVFPELVGVSPDGMFSVEYTGLIAPLVKIVQEQQALITQLTDRIAALEAK